MLLAKRTSRHRLWKVTIYRDDQPAATYEISELIRADAEERAWARFEAQHGRVAPRDPRYRAASEEL